MLVDIKKILAAPRSIFTAPTPNAMTSRRTIVDSLHRCLCPQYFNSPLSFGAVIRLSPARNFSSSVLCHQSTPGDASQDTTNTQAPLNQPIIRKVDYQSFDTTGARRVVHERFNGGPTIAYRPPASQYSGINSVVDLASRSKFPDVFVAAGNLVRGGYVPDAKLYSTLIEACANFPGCLLQGLAFRLFDEMKEAGIMPDQIVYHNLLRVLANSPDYIRRSQILEEMRQRWYTLTDEGWQYVISGYILDGHLEMAMEVIEKRRKNGQALHRNTFKDVIQGLCEAGEVDAAMKLVRDLEADLTWITPPPLTYHLLVAATGRLHLEATLFFWRKIIDGNMFNPDDGLCLATLNVAARYGEPPLASDVFRILGNRGLKFEEHHYAALLESYAVAGDLAAAFSVLSVMRRAGVVPGIYTARPIVTRLAKADDDAMLEDAFKILQEMRRTGKPIDLAAINALIAAYVARNNVEAAFEVYNAMPDFDLRPETSTFNLLLKGAGVKGKKELAMDMVSEMKEIGIPPNANTFEAAFNACLVQDNYEDAFLFLEEMKVRSMVPKIRMYKALARRCYGAGDGRYRVVLKQLKGRIDVAKFLAVLEEEARDSIALWPVYI